VSLIIDSRLDAFFLQHFTWGAGPFLPSSALAPHRACCNQMSCTSVQPCMPSLAYRPRIASSSSY